MTFSLFADDDGALLRQKLIGTFDAWKEARRKSTSTARTQKALNDKSAAVYQEMWHAFADFCCARGLDLQTIETEDLDTFLITRGSGPAPGRPRVVSRDAELSARYARRYLTLIDWVTAFAAKAQGCAPNDAARKLLELPQYRYANAAHKDPLPDFLTEAQAKRLIAFVTQTPDKRAGGSPLKWHIVRNRTAVALMLGAGLTPGDVRHLKMDGVHTEGGRLAGIPWRLHLPGNGNSPARQTPVASWAGRQLAYWLTVRAEQGIPGDYVFPGRRDGGQWSHTRSYVTMREVLEEAGLGNEEGGLFKLRHTFALRQLKRGKSENEVARWLGLLDEYGAMARYRRVLPSPVDVA